MPTIRIHVNEKKESFQVPTIGVEFEIIEQNPEVFPHNILGSTHAKRTHVRPFLALTEKIYRENYNNFDSLDLAFVNYNTTIPMTKFIHS